MKKLLLILTGLSLGFYANAQTPTWSWAESSNTEGSNKTGYDISADSQANTYSVGVFKDTITFGSTQLFATQGTVKGEVFVVKYDNSGNVVWAIQSTGGSNPQANGIYTDVNGNSYITGGFQNTISFGGISETSTNTFGHAIFVAKIDANGTPQWVQSYAAPGFSVTSAAYGNAITLDNSGNIYVGGNYKGDVDFGNAITINNPISQYVSPFVAKFDGLGNVLWAYGTTGGNYSDNVVNDIEVGTDVYIGGTFKGNIYFGTDTLYNTSNRDVFIAKFSATGNYDWAYTPTVTGGSGNVNQGQGIGVDNQNNVYFCGYFSSDITFGTTTTLSCGGFDDCTFIAKIDPTGTTQWATQIGDANSADIYAIDMYTSTDGTSYLTGSMSAGTVNVASDVLTAVNGDVGDLFIIEVDASGAPQWGVKATNTAGYGDGANGIVGTSNGIYITGFYRSTLTAGSTITEAGGTDNNFFVIKLDDNAAVGVEEELTLESLSSYPNPFSNQLFVENNENQNVTISLIDVTGQLVNTTISSDNIISVKTSDLANGIYFVRIANSNTGEVITTQKVIKH